MAESFYSTRKPVVAVCSSCRRDLILPCRKPSCKHLLCDECYNACCKKCPTCSESVAGCCTLSRNDVPASRRRPAPASTVISPAKLAEINWRPSAVWVYQNEAAPSMPKRHALETPEPVVPELLLLPIENCLKTLQGRSDWVKAVAISPDGKWVVSGSWDRSVRVWNRQTGECIMTLQEHMSIVWSVAISLDGKTMVSGSEDETMRVWDLATGECLETLRSPFSVNAVAISPDGTWFASGCLDNSVRVWNVASGKCIKALQGHKGSVHSVAISPDGKWLVSGGSDNNVRVWDQETGDCIQTLQGHTHTVRSVAISGDGKWLVSGTGDKSVRVWNLESGKCIHTLLGHTEGVTSVAISQDGTWLTSGSYDGFVRVWNRESGECIQTLQGHINHVNSVAISPDGMFIVSGSNDKSVRVWKGPAYVEPPVETVSQVPIEQTRAPSLVIPKTTPIVVEKSIETLTGHALPGHRTAVEALAITPDGKTLVSASDDGTLRMWNLETWKCEEICKCCDTGVKAMTISSEGNLAAIISWNCVIQLLRRDTDKWIVTRSWKAEYDISVAISPDGNWLATGTRHYDFGPGNCVRVLDQATGECIRKTAAHSNDVTAITISADGKWIVSGGGDQIIRVLSRRSGQCMRSLNGSCSYITSLVVSLDGNFIVSGAADKCVRVWNFHTGECVKTLQGHAYCVNSVAISSDGEWIVSGSDDMTVRVWNRETGECLQILQGHTKRVTSVAISLDRKLVVSGSEGNIVRVWKGPNFESPTLVASVEPQ